MTGIEHLKSALGSVIRVAMTVESSLEDKKISVIEGIKIGVSAYQLFNSVRDLPVLKAEYADLDLTEKEELMTYFAEEFDLKNNDIEGIIEEVFATLLQLSSLISVVR
jgi:hypothetical protein